MEAFFRVDVKLRNRKLEERYRRGSFDLYRSGAKRSVTEWVGLVWYSAVLLMSFGIPGGDTCTLSSVTVNALLVFIWFMAVFRRFRNRVLLRLLFWAEVVWDHKKPREFTGNRLVFGKEAFQVQSVKNMTWKYPSINKIAESCDAVFLYLKEDAGLYFAKSDFTLGTSEEFLKFIANKTGKDVIRLKG